MAVAIDYEKLKKIDPAIVKALHIEVGARHRAMQNTDSRIIEALNKRVVLFELELPIIKKVLEVMQNVDNSYNVAIRPLWAVRKANETRNPEIAKDLKEDTKEYLEQASAYLAERKNEIYEVKEMIKSLQAEDAPVANYLNGILISLSQDVVYLERTIITEPEKGMGERYR